MKNKNRWQWFALAIVAALLALRWIWGIVSIIYYFERDYEEMQIVADYYSLPENKPENGVAEYRSKTDVEQGNKHNRKVENPEVRKAMINLFDKGYQSIELHSGYTVSFQRWRTLFSGVFRGYAVNLNGREDIAIEFLTEQRPMPKQGWYYYVDDYETWRVA